MLKYTLTILILIITAEAANLPDYFRKCSLSDRNLNNCLTKSAANAWSSMVEGDKSIYMPQLDPLYTTFLFFPFRHDFVGNMSDTIISGLADMTINNIKINLKKKTLDIHFFVPYLNFLGPYDVDGDLLSIRLEGQGIANNTFIDMENYLHIEYELIENKGKHYIEVLNNTMTYNTSKINFQMENIGEYNNMFLDDNWKAVNKEIGGSLGMVIGSTFVDVFKPFFKQVSFEELFLI